MFSAQNGWCLCRVFQHFWQPWKEICQFSSFPIDFSCAKCHHLVSCSVLLQEIRKIRLISIFHPFISTAQWWATSTVHCRLSVLRCQIICKWNVCLCCGQQQAVSALEPQLMLEAAFFRECWMLHWKDVEVSGGYSPPSVFSLSLKDFVLHFYCCSCWPHCINSPNYKIWSSTQVNFFLSPPCPVG